MARTKAVLGSGVRLADYLSASLLARVVPAAQVHAVLDEHGCNTQRVRGFPAVAGVYYCMALSLYPEAAYEEVFAVIAQGLAWAAGAAEPPRVAKSSISAARSRIGAAPLAALVERCCVPLAQPQTHPEAFYAGLRLVALDGSNFEVPDEADNARHFGYPGSRTGQAGYPQAQCAVLVECTTHASSGPTWARTGLASGRSADRCSSGSPPACCVWPIGALMASSAGAKPRPPGRSYCGAARAIGSCRCARA
ncbi:MAG: transposase domain-containing protein, partial [Betaproteobacteria bacterium]